MGQEHLPADLAGTNHGTLVGAVAAATRQYPRVAGKPEAPLFHAAAKRLAAERPLVVRGPGAGETPGELADALGLQSAEDVADEEVEADEDARCLPLDEPEQDGVEGEGGAELLVGGGEDAHGQQPGIGRAVDCPGSRHAGAGCATAEVMHQPPICSSFCRDKLAALDVGNSRVTRCNVALASLERFNSIWQRPTL